MISDSEILQLIREQSPWVIEREAIKLDEKVVEALERKHKLLYTFKTMGNLLIIGPRRSGKTTLLKLLAYDLIVNKKVDNRKVIYISCEPLTNHRDLIAIFRFLDRENAKYIFLDEVTFVEGWEKAVKYYLDTKLRRNKTLYITGSTTATLRKESFPGREIKIVYHLPVNFKKFVELFGSEKVRNSIGNPKKLRYFIEELNHLLIFYLECGGFPETMYQLMEEGKIKSETYEIIEKWILGDLSKLDRSIKTAYNLLRGIVKRYGAKYSLNSIAKEFDIKTHKTVGEYLETLENLLVIRQVFQADPTKKTVLPRKERKTYFTDPLLYNLFSKKLLFKTPTAEDTPKKVEGVIGEHLFREKGEAYYCYTNKETDFILLKEQVGIEVKWQDQVTEKDFENPHLFKKRILISKKTLKEGKTKIVPASIFLLTYPKLLQ